MTLVDDMRPADVEECAVAGLTPKQALDLSIQLSDEVFSYYHDGVLLARGGWAVDSFVLNSARMWLLTTCAADDHRFAFARDSKQMLKMLLTKFRSIRCDVYVGHKAAVRWLMWLGFRPERVRYHGPDAAPFYVMVRERGPWDS